MPTRTQVRDQIERPDWLPAEVWPFTLRSFERIGSAGSAVRIHYTDEGEGPVLVFVHAGMWSFIWRDVIAELRTDFRCITLDFPGAGLSTGGRDDVDLEQFPTIVNELLDRCGVESATFVVHDLGGAVGLVAAGRRPDRADGLVVTNSFGWPPDRTALRTMLSLVGSWTVMSTLGTLRPIPRMTRTRMGVGRHLDRAGRQAFFGPYRSRTYGRNFHRAMRSASRSTSLFDEAARSIERSLTNLPVLTVFGEKNDPFGFGARWKRLYPNAEEWIVPGGNHFPMCDDPAGFAAHLRAWRARNLGEACGPTRQK